MKIESVPIYPGVTPVPESHDILHKAKVSLAQLPTTLGGGAHLHSTPEELSEETSCHVAGMTKRQGTRNAVTFLHQKVQIFSKSA